jgi:hypothetical protein
VDIVTDDGLWDDEYGMEAYRDADIFLPLKLHCMCISL